VCATELQRAITKRAEETPKSTSDFLRKDIPGVKLPHTKSLCPQCGLELEGREAKCPRCGIPLSAEEALIECPECGALSPKDTKSCNRCGCNLRERRVPSPAAPIAKVPSRVPPVKPARVERPVKPEAPVVAEKVTPPPAPTIRAEPAMLGEETSAPSPARSSAQGLVNGRGAVNGTGLTNGRGAVNGTGLVNGRGTINGTGITNGARSEVRLTTGASRSKSVVSRWQFLALLVALLVIVPTFMYLTYSKESASITVDGNFEDWSDVRTFGMYQNSVSDGTNVTEWAVKTDSSHLYVYVVTRGNIMSTAVVDSFFVFVDADGLNTTGYLVSDIGADYRVEFDGWNGSVGASSTSRYVIKDQDQKDWNSWEDFGTPTPGLGADRFEGVADLPSLGDKSRYVLISQSANSGHGISYAIHEDTPILIIHQEAGSGASSGIVVQAASVNAMRLSLSCQGGPGSVTSILPSVSGATPLSLQTGTISLSVGGSQTVDVLVNTATWASGSVVGVSLSASDVTSSFDSVAVVGDPVRAYIGSVPLSIQIDGAFADWAGKTAADTDSTEMKDANVDIKSVGAVNTTLSSSFYASVEGEMCGGSFVPAQMTKPSGSSGGTVIPTKKTGEDILRVHLDTDLSVTTGSIVTHPTKTIGADYIIEVKGLNGKITSKSLMQFASGTWNYVPGVVAAANNGQQIELSLSSSSISGTSSIDFIIEMTDWRGWSDIATSVPLGTRGADMPGTRAWIVDTSTHTEEATATSNQRKLFFDGVNFWSVHVDNGNTIARYSTDGTTWTLDGRVFNQNGVVRPSIWYDSANQAVYAIGDRTTSTRNVYLQKGIVSPSTHTITWSAGDRVLAVSTNAMPSKNTFISMDASGYLWIMSVNRTTTTPSSYDLSVFKSTAINSVAGTWTMTGSMQVNSAESTIKGSVLPTGTGSDVWAVYVYDGTVASKKYTGTWGAESVLYAASGAGGNTEEAPPSALVDTMGVLHVVYGTDHEQPVGTSKPHIYYMYNTGSAWSAAVALSSTLNTAGFGYPTISLDASTGNLYAFWYDTQTRYVDAKRNVSGTWSTLTLNAQTTDPKMHLTSIYSAPGEAQICYQWTQNTTNPIHVLFDRIPEFSDAALPALGMIAMVVFVIRPMRRRGLTD